MKISSLSASSLISVALALAVVVVPWLGLPSGVRLPLVSLLGGFLLVFNLVSFRSGGLNRSSSVYEERAGAEDETTTV